MIPQPAFEIEAAQWFNTQTPPSLLSLRGRVVVLHAFQMLCPGCVQSGLPQAQKIAALFPPDDVAVIGIHTVFEHHAAMTPVSLAAFIHEYRLRFPIAVDQPSQTGPIPRTMAAYEMQGTPSLILIDAKGNLRRHTFGAEEDMVVGAAIATLLAEKRLSDE